MTEPCRHEGRLATLEHQDQVHKDTLARIEAKMDIMMAQISKVALLESNHDHQAAAVGRAFGELEKMAGKVASHDRAVYLAMGFIAAMSVFWTVMGYRINAQIDDVVRSVAEMKAHVAADKILNADDINPAVKR